MILQVWGWKNEKCEQPGVFQNRGNIPTNHDKLYILVGVATQHNHTMYTMWAIRHAYAMCGQSDTASAPVLNKKKIIQNFYTTLLRNPVYKRGNTTSPPLFLDKGNGRNSWVHPRAEWTLTGSSKSLTSEQTKIILRTLSCPNHPSQFDQFLFQRFIVFFVSPSHSSKRPWRKYNYLS